MRITRDSVREKIASALNLGGTDVVAATGEPEGDANDLSGEGTIDIFELP